MSRMYSLLVHDPRDGMGLVGYCWQLKISVIQKAWIFWPKMMMMLMTVMMTWGPRELRKVHVMNIEYILMVHANYVTPIY